MPEKGFFHKLVEIIADLQIPVSYNLSDLTKVDKNDSSKSTDNSGHQTDEQRSESDR